MSDFLLNLVRRGAGLAPVVRSRAAAVGSDAPTDEPGQAAVAHEKRAVVSEPAAMALPPVALPAQPVRTSHPVVTPMPTAQMPTAVVQRLALGSPVAAAAAAATVAHSPVADVSPVVATPRPRGDMQTPPPDRPLGPPAAAIIMPTPMPSEWHAASLVVAPVALPPPSDPSSKSDINAVERATEPARDIVREHTRIVEHVEPAPASTIETSAILIEPATAVVAAAVPMRGAEPTPDRTVYVRIGAIEIHAEQPAPVPLPPSPQPAVAPIAPWPSASTSSPVCAATRHGNGDAAMSDFRAIGGVSVTLQALLFDRMELPDGVPSVPVTVGPPAYSSKDVDPHKEDPRVNLFLYRVTENGHLQNQEIPGRGSPSAYGHPPLSLNLHYLLSTYGNVEVQPGDNALPLFDETTAQFLLGSARRRRSVT